MKRQFEWLWFLTAKSQDEKEIEQFFKVLKGKNYQFIIPLPMKITFRNEGKIKTF